VCGDEVRALIPPASVASAVAAENVRVRLVIRPFHEPEDSEANRIRNGVYAALPRGTPSVASEKRESPGALPFPGTPGGRLPKKCCDHSIESLTLQTGGSGRTDAISSSRRARRQGDRAIGVLRGCCRPCCGCGG